MSNLLKSIVIAAPFAALLFYYAMLKQSQMDTEMRKQNLQFEQEWNRFNEDFIFTSQRHREAYEERNQEIAKKLQDIRKQEEEQKKKQEEFEKEFEESLNQNGNLNKLQEEKR